MFTLAKGHRPQSPEPRGERGGGWGGEDAHARLQSQCHEMGRKPDLSEAETCSQSGSTCSSLTLVFASGMSFRLAAAAGALAGAPGPAEANTDVWSQTPISRCVLNVSALAGSPASEVLKQS